MLCICTLKLLPSQQFHLLEMVKSSEKFGGVLQVLSVAVNSGIVAYPVSFKSIYSSPKLSLWLPVAPEGYAAIGCLATTNETSPSVTDIGCLHQKVLVEAPLGQLLSLKPQPQPRLSGGSTNDLMSFDSGHLDSHKQGYVWCVENCAASFIASADGHAPHGGQPRGPTAFRLT